MRKGTLACPLDDRTVSHRIAERYTELNDVRARLNRSENNVACRCEVWIAARDVGDEGRTVVKVDRHPQSPSFRFSRSIPTSLSPRPETFTITTSDFFIFGARLITSATACDDSSAGIIPSVRANSVQASSASASEAETYSARPESFSHACSGPIDG